MSQDDPTAAPPDTAPTAAWGGLGEAIERLEACGADRLRLGMESVALSLEAAGGGEGACWLLAEGSTTLERCPSRPAEWTTAELGGEALAARAARTGRPASDEASIAVPLLAGGRALGALELRPAAHPLSPASVASLLAVARLCAWALERALCREAREAESRASGAAARVKLLAEASRAFAAAGLDLEAAYANVAREVGDLTGDACLLTLLTDDGLWLKPVAVYQPTPGLEADLYEATRQPCRLEDGLLGRVLQSGEPLLVSFVEPDAPAFRSHPGLRAYLERNRPVSLLGVPLRLRGRVSGVLGVIRHRGRPHDHDDLAMLQDVTDRAALTIENARLYRETQEASRLKDEFLATISHELRTPLNAVLGWATMLRDQPGDEQAVRRGLDIIKRNALAQARLIEDVLDVSRIITGRLRLEPRPVDVAQVVRAAVDAIGPAAQAKSISVRASIDEQIGLVDGDPDRLQQIVWNLASNAVKFTPQGGEVAISASREADGVVLRIRDNGAGIEPSFLPHVFERFRQADSSTTRRHGGLGLGLAIARHLVELHGGAISVDSPGPGKGTTFTVVLPAGSNLPWALEPSTARRTSSPGLAAPGLSGLRVLVVDDEPDGRELLARMLSEGGATVDVAESAAEALGVIEQRRPDVLVSDIAMPGEDGYALIRKVRALGAERGGRTPAVALTAHAREEDARRAFAAGFQMHVPKPVDRSTLLAIVANLGGRTSED